MHKAVKAFIGGWRENEMGRQRVGLEEFGEDASDEY